MTEPMTELPPGAVLATTWEDCAAHLEQHADMGGEVWYRGISGKWWRDTANPADYRRDNGAPGAGGLQPRALVPPKWRRCDDPAELAAAVAAGVEVEGKLSDEDAWGPLACVTAADFRWGLDRGARCRVPVSWEWEPCATDPCEACAERAKAAAPVPPWPGAVLSGCVDEDGVPTWLAQAGDVRGEQVRWCYEDGWRVHPMLPPESWVEVRAPRAVPEPETERVSWWEAVGREVFDQDGERVTIEHVQCGDGAGPSVTAYNAAERRGTSLLRVPITVRGDGTVEVLKDGGR